MYNENETGVIKKMSRGCRREYIRAFELQSDLKIYLCLSLLREKSSLLGGKESLCNKCQRPTKVTMKAVGFIKIFFIILIINISFLYY